ncbi:MAG: pyruvate ferredoxin oxidoreductase [Fervidicoccaceae archaeon]
MLLSEKKKEKMVITGNHAVAYAVKLSRVKVISAYPITPQTSIVEKLSEFVEKGELDASIIKVESEHSALAAVYGAAIAGARSFTATSSHGLLYMHEWVHWFSRARIPTVMAVVTRTIGPPWNIWPDHSDFIDQRDAGWIMSFAMDNQEVVDLVIQAFKIGEDPSVYLPVMIGLEGFILGGTAMPVELPFEEDVAKFLGERRQPYSVADSVVSVGNLTSPEDTELMQMDIQAAMERSKEIIRKVDEEYGRLFGRKYGGLTSCYRCEDAKYVAFTMGAWSGDAMEAVDILRNQGIDVGLVRIRYVRPFPSEEIKQALSSARMGIVFDRSISFGGYGQLFEDIASAIVNAREKATIVNVIAGLGGVNITAEDFANVLGKLISDFEEGKELSHKLWYHSGEVMKY